jgi:hypothetical protein
MMIACLRAIVCIAAMLGFATPGSAATAGTTWLCWLHADSLRAVCTLPGLAAGNNAAGQEPHAARADTMKPRQLMHGIRDRTALLAGQPVYVPLHNVPFDSASVGVLARSVLCGNDTACDVRYHPDVAHLVAEAPELFSDLNDPLFEGRAL